jgi:hypothetical protein
MAQKLARGNAGMARGRAGHVNSVRGPREIGAGHGNSAPGRACSRGAENPRQMDGEAVE